MSYPGLNVVEHRAGIEPAHDGFADRRVPTSPTVHGCRPPSRAGLTGLWARQDDSTPRLLRMFRLGRPSCWARYPGRAERTSCSDLNSSRHLNFGGSGRCCPGNVLCWDGSFSKRVRPPVYPRRFHGGGERTCTSPPVTAPRFQRGGPPAAQRLHDRDQKLEETARIKRATPEGLPGSGRVGKSSAIVSWRRAEVLIPTPGCPGAIRFRSGGELPLA